MKNKALLPMRKKGYNKNWLLNEPGRHIILNSYQRVKAVLEGSKPDRVPLFEVWIDALLEELEISDPLRAHPQLGQDVVLLPSTSPAESKAWKDGLDEFGRIWSRGFYKDGAIKNSSDLKQFNPPAAYAEKFFSDKATSLVINSYPDHFPFFGTHIGPFMSTYMAMGMDHMFFSLYQDFSLVKAVMETRTKWCLVIFKEAVKHGAELIVMGDDAAHRGGPMISPAVWEELVLPHHRKIVDELPVPVIWHSDGRMDKLLPFAIKAGFAGIHGMEPPAGNSLSKISQQYGNKLILIGNVDVNLLCGSDQEAVSSDVDRCLEQGSSGRFMLSTSNSIFKGMNPRTVKAYFEEQNKRFANPW